MIILAHRGMWTAPAEKNTAGALSLAWANGYGIETDIRDHDGVLVISHDPPTGTALLTADELFRRYKDLGAGTTLALNIKADGLQDRLAELLIRHAIAPDSYFVFDMAVPDALGYLRRGVPCFTRESEYETAPAFLERAQGVWMDCFHDDWIDQGAMERHLRSGRRLALVSPELHGRPHSQAWSVWRKALRSLGDREAEKGVLLCTDFPEEAGRYFDA